MQKSKPARWFGLTLIYGLPLALYMLVAWQSWGFDDEIYNIKLVEHSDLADLVMRVETDDVHPPLGFVINYLLFELLGSWSLVRVATAVFVVAGLARLCEWIRDQHGERGWRLAWVGLLLSPSMLMWCTSIRWYSYVMPLLALALVLPRRRAGASYWLVGAGLCLAMAYTSYIGLLASIGVLLWRWLNRDPEERHLALAAGAVALAGLAWLPQLHFLLDYHLRNMGGQVAPMLHSLGGLVVTAFSNHGLFPVSLPALALFAAWALFLAMNLRPRDLVSRAGLPLLVMVVLLVVSGLSFKYRNALILLPFLFLWAASKAEHDTWGNRVFLLVLAVSGVIGLQHVVRHQDTLKNGWNIPYDQVFDAVARREASCAATYVVAFDQIVLDHLQRSGYRPADPASGHAARPCLLLVDASQTLAEGKLIQEMTAAREPEEVVQISHDEQSSLRRLIIPTYVNEGVRIFVYHDPAFCSQQCNLLHFYSRRP